MRNSMFRAAAFFALVVYVLRRGGRLPTDVFGCTDRDRFRVGVLTSGPNCEVSLRDAQPHLCAARPPPPGPCAAIATFGNAGCVSGSANALGVSAIELANACHEAHNYNSPWLPE